MLEYRKEGIMGGDNIPRRPPIWACACGCKRFHEVNPDGTDAPVKVKLLKNIRKAPADKINRETSMVERALQGNMCESIHHYKVEIETELGEILPLSVAAMLKTRQKHLYEKAFWV